MTDQIAYRGYRITITPEGSKVAGYTQVYKSLEGAMKFVDQLIEAEAKRNRDPYRSQI